MHCQEKVTTKLAEGKQRSILVLKIDKINTKLHILFKIVSFIGIFDLGCINECTGLVMLDLSNNNISNASLLGMISFKLIKVLRNHRGG